MESLQYTSFNTTEVNHSNIQKYFLDDKKNYHCTFPGCGKVFKFKSEMSRHAVIHYESRPFTCPYEGCNKNFKRSDALDTHIRLHTKENPFVCDEPDCGMSFVTKAALKYHVLKHNNERAYKCTFPGCTKTFFTKGQLKQHEKSYSYHVNLVGYKMMRKDVHATIVYPQDTQGYYTEFFPPVPEMVQNIQWETKNPEEADEADEAIHYKQELVQETEVQLPVPVQETPVVIKDEVNLDVKISEGLDEQQPNLSLALNEDWIESMKEPAIFFDEDEFKVLEFFRDYSFRGY